MTDMELRAAVWSVGISIICLGIYLAIQAFTSRVPPTEMADIAIEQLKQVGKLVGIIRPTS